MRRRNLERGPMAVRRSRPGRAGGFTLVELMLATLIMAVIITAAFSTWTSSISAIKRARALTENLQRQRALLDMLSQTFRSALFAQNNAQWYQWETDDLGDADSVSFVATHIPEVGGQSQSGNIPQRVQISLEPDDSGRLVLLARIKNFLANDIDDAGKTIVLADWVNTFSLRYYDPDNDEWDDTWDNDQAMPGGVELTMSFTGSNPAQGDITVVKNWMIPSAAASTQLSGLADLSLTGGPGAPPLKPGQGQPGQPGQTPTKPGPGGADAPSAPSKGGKGR